MTPPARHASTSGRHEPASTARSPPPHRFAPTRSKLAAPRPRPRQRRDQDDHLGDRLPPRHSWLDVPVLDRKGNIRHDGGVVAAPGMYLMGMPFLRRRKSSFIDGAGDDARDLSDHLYAYLDRKAAMTLVAAE